MRWGGAKGCQGVAIKLSINDKQRPDWSEISTPYNNNNNKKLILDVFSRSFVKVQNKKLTSAQFKELISF